MASRSRVEFDERESSFFSDRGSRRGREETDFYERRESHERRAPSRGAPAATIAREREESRVPSWMREESRQTDAGQLVLRQRDVETIERQRVRRSPSPARVRETRIVHRARSVTPPPVRRRVEEEDVRIKTVERERVRSPSRGPTVDRVRTRFVERERSISPAPPPPARIERVQARYVERPRSASPIERERIRIIERERERYPSPSPSPSPSPPPPPPQVIKGPRIEREVVTHYIDVDHGVVSARPPSPPPQPRPRQKERDTEIDIYTSRNATEVDIHKSTRRGRSASRERLPPVRVEVPREHVRGDEIVVASSRDRLEVDIHERHRHRRAHSAAPPASSDYSEEAEYITDKIESRGRMGEAYHGATKDWTIVDVPPGTERVRMDGVGGASADVSWQRYSGVRRAKFIPERERETISSSTTVSSDREVAIREQRDDPRESRLSVQVHDKHRDHEIDVDVERVTDRRNSTRPAAPVPRKPDTWTEITKDLIVREAMEEMGYEYEETDQFFYVMQYLRYEDVNELVQLSDRIRQARRDRARELDWSQHEWHDDWAGGDRRDRHRHRHRHRHSQSTDRWEDDRVFEREREVVVDHRRGFR